VEIILLFLAVAAALHNNVTCPTPQLQAEYMASNEGKYIGAPFQGWRPIPTDKIVLTEYTWLVNR
jgi:hypothetical protein